MTIREGFDLGMKQIIFFGAFCTKGLAMLQRLTGHTLRVNSPQRYNYACTGYIVEALELLAQEPDTGDYSACNVAYRRAQSLDKELAAMRRDTAGYISGLSEDDHVIDIACVAIVRHVMSLLLGTLNEAAKGARCTLRPHGGDSNCTGEDNDNARACSICTDAFSDVCVESKECAACGRADMCTGCVELMHACPWCRSCHVGHSPPAQSLDSMDDLPAEFLAGFVSGVDIAVYNAHTHTNRA